MTRPPDLPQLPPGACDCHTHVFLEGQAFPLWPARRYTPPPASIAALCALHDALGISRVVVVQPSVYGPDNAATWHALGALGPDRARGVAVLDDDVSDETLDLMTQAGFRGVRVNLEIDGESDASRASAWLRRIADRVGPKGWHVQVFASLPLLAACSDLLATLPVPLVFDHYAGAQGRLGPQQEGLSAICALVERGKAYVKLSAPYRCSDQPGYADMEPIARLLIACNPERMLWGSDWPHPQPGVRQNPTDTSPPFEVDVGATLVSMRQWAPDEATLHTMLVDNPARLYGFAR